MGEINVYGFEMARVSEVYLSTLSKLMKPYGIERYFVALIHLCESKGTTTQKDLSDALRKDKVSTMRIVDYLSERDLIRRKENSEDRRCHILEVTDKGYALLPIVKDAVQKTNELLFHNFKPSQKKQFKKSMDSLYQTIESLPSPDFKIEAVKIKK
ncbi:MAG: MarR family transcriptional regulator [Bacteroidia bacterium]